MHERPTDDPPRPGDIVVYRCEDCLDRWDIVVDDEGCRTADNRWAPCRWPGRSDDVEAFPHPDEGLGAAVQVFI